MRCCSDGLVVVLVVAWRMWWMWDEGGMYLVVVGCCGLAWCWEWRAAAAVAAPNLSLHSAPPRPMLPSAAARPGNRECDVMRLAAAGLGVSTSCGLWLCASRGWALEGGECFCLETPPKFPDAVALGRTRDAAAAQSLHAPFDQSQQTAPFAGYPANSRCFNDGFSIQKLDHEHFDEARGPVRE